MALEGKVSFDDESVSSSQKDFDEPIRRVVFKKKGESIRAAFLTNDSVMRMRHYVKGAGYRRCLAYQGFCPACLSSDIKDATEAFGSNVFVYKTTPVGSGIPKVVDPISGDVNIFIFGSDKFISLRAIKQMYGSLVGIDLLITCTDPAFQKLTIQAFPKEQSLISKPQVLAYIKEKYKSQAYPIEKMICKEVNPAQLITDYSIKDVSLPVEGSKMDKVPSDAFVAEAASLANNAVTDSSPLVADVVATPSVSDPSVSDPSVTDSTTIDSGSILDEL